MCVCVCLACVSTRLSKKLRLTASSGSPSGSEMWECDWPASGMQWASTATDMSVQQLLCFLATITSLTGLTPPVRDSTLDLSAWLVSYYAHLAAPPSCPHCLCSLGGPLVCRSLLTYSQTHGMTGLDYTKTGTYSRYCKGIVCKVLKRIWFILWWVIWMDYSPLNTGRYAFHLWHDHSNVKRPCSDFIIARYALGIVQKCLLP